MQETGGFLSPEDEFFFAEQVPPLTSSSQSVCSHRFLLSAAVLLSQNATLVKDAEEYYRHMLFGQPQKAASTLTFLALFFY